MSPENMKPGHWYWLRQENGSLAPFRFHRVKKSAGKHVGEFYVGSMLTTWSLGKVVAEAEMPQERSSGGDFPDSPSSGAKK